MERLIFDFVDGNVLEAPGASKQTDLCWFKGRKEKENLFQFI